MMVGDGARFETVLEVLLRQYVCAGVSALIVSQTQPQVQVKSHSFESMGGLQIILKLKELFDIYPSIINILLKSTEML